MRRILLGLCFLSFLNSASGQEIPLPEKMPQTHPRVLTTPAGKQETWKLIKKEEWAPYLQSVVIFGRCHLIDDSDKTIEKVRKLATKYYPNKEEVEMGIQKSIQATQLYEIEIEHMTGKQIQEK